MNKLLIFCGLISLLSCSSNANEGTKTEHKNDSEEVASKNFEKQNAVASPLADDILIPYRNRNNKWGFCDKHKKIIIECVYDNAYPFSDDRAAVKSKNRWGYIDKAGKLVIPCIYRESMYLGTFHGFKDGMALVDTSWNGFGYINKIGKVIAPLIYGIDDVSKNNISEGLVAIPLKPGNEVGNYLGYIDSSGKFIIPCKFSRAGDFHNGLASVAGTFDDGFPSGYINKTGRQVFSSYGDDFSEGMARIGEAGNLRGYIDKTGKVIVPCKYDDRIHGGEFEDGLALVSAGIEGGGSQYIGYINKTGKVSIPFVYDAADIFSEGLAYADSAMKKRGYIDTTGKVVFKCNYEYCYPFSGGLARVATLSDPSPYTQKGNGFIDKTGNLIIPLMYDDVYGSFKDGLVRVKIHDKWGYIDKAGNQFWE